MFSMQWPPKSGKQQEFPEVDRASWFSPAEAIRKVLKGQRPILKKLLSRLEPKSLEAVNSSSGSQGSLF